MTRMMHVLPVEAYTSTAWFEREQELIFSRTWRYAGFMEDIAEPGDTLVVQAGLNNIFIVKGRDQRLRAFHNICRHRGTQLIRAVGKAQKALTCPYHDWTYDLEGQLISVPEEAEEFPGLDKSCLGLKPASVDLWRGMLFVHPDPNAGSIMNWFGDIEPYLGPHNVEELVEHPEAASTYEIKANWKIVVENYIDVYHLSHLHSGTLNMYDHAKAEYGFVGPHYAFWEPLTADYLADVEKHAAMPLVLPKDQVGAWVPMLFPGLGLGESETDWSIFHITPLGPELSRVETRTRVKNASNWEFQKQEWRSAPFWSKKLTGKYSADDATGEDDPMVSGDFSAEDIHVCEQLQKSLKSPYFETGPSAQAGESPVREHQQIVLNYLQSGSLSENTTEPDIPTKTIRPLRENKAGDEEDFTPGMAATAQVTLRGVEHSVNIAAGQTVLAAIRAAGLEPPFSCQAGVCGKCRVRLHKGAVHMQKRMALTDEEIADGVILPCQSVATTPQLTLAYNG